MTNIDIAPQKDARVLTWSLRNIQNFVYNSCLFEFEDVISEVDRADIYSPPQFDQRSRAINKAIVSTTRHVKPLPLTSVNPYLKSESLDREYDMYFVTLDFPWFGSSINLLKDWRERCKTAVCYIVEIWTEDIPKMKNFMKFFDQFDLICIGTRHVLDDVQAITDKPVIFVPPGVDTIKFCPDLDSKKCRSIDVTNLGRRSLSTHNALLEKAEKEDFFYYHELTNGSVLRVEDHQAHRTLIANLLGSSRYYITNYAKADMPDLIAGEYEIGYRFFEGAAAGAVLIGAQPKGDLYDKYFDWEDSIIPVNFDEPNIADIIDELDARPGYVESIQARNAMNSLLKHDWVYRWEMILEALGQEPTPGIITRKQKLREMAAALEPRARSVKAATQPATATTISETAEPALASVQA